MTHIVPLDDRGSFAWIAHPDEGMQRASSAVVTASGILVVDPVDFDGLDVALGRLGLVAGVVQLLDRHSRDVAPVAARHAAPVLVPRALGGEGERLAIDGVHELTVLAMRGWHEAALWLPDRGLLICTEAVGTAEYYLARDGDALGIHPLLRLRPPAGALAGIEPSVIAVGHGAPIVQGAAAALAVALRRSRRDLPRAWGRVLGRRLHRRRNQVG